MQIRLLRRPIYRITKYVGKILSWNFTLLLKKLQKNLRDFCCTRCICLPAEQFHIMSTRGWHGKIFCTHSTWLSVFCYTFSSCPPHSLLLALHIIFLHLVFCVLFLLCTVIKHMFNRVTIVLQLHTGWPKRSDTLFVRVITSSNIDQFSNIFHYRNQEKICNNIITKDPTAPQVCRYTTLWNASVLKASIENKTTSETMHFKSASSSSKADTLNILCKNCRMWVTLDNNWDNKHVVSC